MIETHDLTRRFGSRLAVDSLSLRIGDGEIVGLLGPNGAGKTTSLRMIAGILGPTSGRAMVEGVDPAVDPGQAHETIGFLTEAAGFYDRMTAHQNLTYFARFYTDVDERSAVGRALDLVGLSDRARDRVGTYSKGMKQRLALARALLHEPRVLLLDEPTVGLDPEAAKDLRATIRSFREGRRAILLSTHNLAEAEELSDRIAVLRTQLLALDTPSALRAAGEAVRMRVEATEWSDLVLDSIQSEAFVLTVSKPSDGAVSFGLDDPARDRSRLVATLVELGVELLAVTEETRTLEDVYLDLVREDPA